MALLMDPRNDDMARTIVELTSYFSVNRGAIALSGVQPENRYTALFQDLTPTQMELLRHCGKYADFKKWIVRMKYFDVSKDDRSGTESFNKMITHVTQLLQVSVSAVPAVAWG
jgi:hypothetical protein